MKQKIGIIGECMIELIDQGGSQYRQTYGGDTLNTAVYMARLADSDLSVHYITALGNDSLSRDMANAWEADGVDTSLVEFVEGELPGLYLIQTDSQGERSFLYWRNSSPVKKLFTALYTESLKQRLMSFDWLYFTGITLAVLEVEGRRKLFELLGSFRAAGGKVAFDPNYRPKLWEGEDVTQWFRLAYHHCNIAMPSIEDEYAVWGEQNPESVVEHLHGLGCEELVIKRGEDSCILSDGSQLEEYKVPSVDSVVDTTAAGDSFNGAYLASRLQGGTIAESVSMGQKVAGQVIGQKGAIVPIQL